MYLLPYQFYIIDICFVPMCFYMNTVTIHIIPYYISLYFPSFVDSIFLDAGSEIAPSSSPMRLKIEYWRPEFHSWSPVGDLLLSSEPFANKCFTF